MDTLSPQEAAGLLRTTPNTLRRWRNENVGPPYVKGAGGKPRYRSDLLMPGDYTIHGLQEKFPAAKVEVADASGLSEAEQNLLLAILAKCETSELADEDDIVFVSTSDELDVSEPLCGGPHRACPYSD